MQQINLMRCFAQRGAARLRGTAVAAAMISILVAMSGSALAAPDRGPKVYLLRGFMNVFSLGLDEIATKLEQRGIRAEVYNHTSALRLAGEIASEYKSGKTRPIVLVGHSAGGAAIVDLVDELGRAGVPVALAVTLDIASRPVSNMRGGTFLNLYAGTGALTKGPGFRGNLVNMEVSKNNGGVNHFTIEKSEPVQALVLRYINSAVGRGGPRRAVPASAAAPQPTAPRT